MADNTGSKSSRNSTSSLPCDFIGLDPSFHHPDSFQLDNFPLPGDALTRPTSAQTYRSDLYSGFGCHSGIHSRSHSFTSSTKPLTIADHSRSHSAATSTIRIVNTDFADGVRSPPNGRFPATERDGFNIFSDILSYYPLPHLSRLPSNTNLRAYANQRRPGLYTPTYEQRHPGKEGARLTRLTRPWSPDLDNKANRKSRISLRAVKTETTEDGYLKGLPLGLLVLGLCMVVFLISIDRTIITTAIPFITAEFHSTADIGWYGSSYLLTACAFQPVFGRVFTLFHIKWSYMLSMFMFLLGSFISGMAPSSVCLIVGRAVAGFGSAGILTGSFLIVAIGVPLQLRPIYTAAVGLMFGVGATVGPLIGGLFTDLVSWRWCFWINLPIGGVTVVTMLLVFNPPRHRHLSRPFFDRIIDLDIIGNIILLGASIMLFLALEFTTMGIPWGSPKIIGLFCGAGLTFIVFVLWQWWKQDGALIPPAIVTQRTVSASCLMAFFTYGALLIHTYFLPIWFQAIRGDTAIQSGIVMIPYFVANALFSLFSGFFVSKIGYFTAPAIIGSAIGTIGCGVITLLSPTTSTGTWIGFEILASAGFGMSIQQGFTAVQSVLPKESIAVGTASVVASQSLGGAIFISVGNSLFQARLRALASDGALPGLDVQAVISAGATAFRDMVTPEQLQILVGDYNGALQSVLTLSIPLGALACISCCFLEWKSIITKKEEVPIEKAEAGDSSAPSTPSTSSSTEA